METFSERILRGNEEGKERQKECGRETKRADGRESCAIKVERYKILETWKYEKFIITTAKT